MCHGYLGVLVALVCRVVCQGLPKPVNVDAATARGGTIATSGNVALRPEPCAHQLHALGGTVVFQVHAIGKDKTGALEVVRSLDKPRGGNGGSAGDASVHGDAPDGRHVPGDVSRHAARSPVGLAPGRLRYRREAQGGFGRAAGEVAFQGGCSALQCGGTPFKRSGTRRQGGQGARKIRPVQ